MKALFYNLGLLCLFTGISAIGAPNPAKHAKVESVKPLELVAGKTIELKIHIVIDRGFHIQANPASTPQLIATVLEMDQLSQLELGKPIYPPGKSYRLQGAPSDISTYDGKVEIKLPVTVKEKPAVKTWKGKIRYQACNNQTCFFPVWEDFVVPIR
jgi:hypothetical protein